MLIKRINILALAVLALAIMYQPYSIRAADIPQQTIPTRTSTPSSQPSPTGEPVSSPTRDDGGSDSTAVPTSTLPSVATATPTSTATATQEFDPGSLPTASLCGTPPTLQPISSASIRLGPGTDYESIGFLSYPDVRRIVGRAAEAAWWLIELEDGSTGWVADETVNVHGYVGDLMIAPAPLLNNQTATPGLPWNPTPNSLCNGTPTPALTLTPDPFTTPATVMAITGTVTEDSPPPDQSNEAPTQTAVSPPTLAPTKSPGTGDIQTIDADGTNTSSIPFLNTPTRRLYDLLLPAAGILLLTTGVIVAINNRQNATKKK